MAMNRTQYIDPTSGPAMKMMDKYLTQTASYSNLHSSTLATLTTLQNQHAQLMATIEVQRSHTSFSKLTAEQLQSLPLHAPPDSGFRASIPKRNPVLEKFPDLAGRLVMKLDVKMSESLEDVRRELGEMSSIVKNLGALRRDSLSKATMALKEYQDLSNSRTSTGDRGGGDTAVGPLRGHLPLIVEVADWIDGLASGYELEIKVLETLLRQIDLTSKEGISNVERIIKRWGEQTLLDLRWEQEVTERLKLLRTLAEQ
ncbi:hypothetical protein HDV05_004997 [Chytridiales sp. JEL 0842]|nr:hypothetical protein HDV05_004997 [Chytridiales sp. JEL 0842]